MLGTLPHEIILQISSYLPFYDRLNLSQTCRCVHGCVVNGNLYERLFVPQQHVDSVLNYFRSNIIDHSQVKVLKISFPVDKEDYFYELSAIFPNLRELCTGACKNSSKKLKPKQAEDIQSIRDKLNVYDTRNCHKAVLLLMNKYQFNHITDLYLESSFFRANNKFKLNVFQCITNTPSLLTLKLEKFQINLGFFEKMHAANASIRELELTEIKLIINETELPQAIVPYQPLQSLKITCKKFIDRNLLFVDYITDKYSHLTSFDINNWMLIARANTPGYHSVSTFRNYHPILADRILPLVARVKVLKIEPRLFENFFDNVGPSLDHLTGLGIYSSKDTFTMFKHINELNFIQSLHLLTSLSVEAKYSRFLYHKKVTIPNIKNLDIFGQMAFTSRSIELDQLLFTYNGLENLDLSCKNARVVVGNPDAQTHYQNLQRLILHAGDISPSIGTYIANCLPNMKELQLIQ